MRSVQAKLMGGALISLVVLSGAHESSFSLAAQSGAHGSSQVDGNAESAEHLVPAQSYQDVSKGHMAYLTEAPRDVVEKLHGNRQARGTVSIMTLIGNTHQKLQAARFIMGESLENEKFKHFLLGIEEAEGASKIIRDQMSRAIKKTSENINDIPSEIKRLRKRIQRSLEKNCGHVRWMRSGCRDIEKLIRPDYYKQLQEIVDPIISEPADVPDTDFAKKTYENADGLFKKVLKTMASDFNVKDQSEQVETSEQRMRKAGQALSDAELAYSKAAERLNTANANMEVIDQAGRLKMNVVEMFQNYLAKAEKDLQEIEDRLRRYTFNMYSWYTSTWSNDVKLAEREKKDKMQEIEQLRSKIELHKENEFQSVGSGNLAQLKSELATAQQMKDTTWQRVQAARKEVNEARKLVQEDYDRMAKNAEKNGVMNIKQISLVKKMASSLNEDSIVIDNINKAAKENLYESLARACKNILQEMKNADYIHEQLSAVDDLLEAFPIEDEHDFKDNTKALVSLYKMLDHSKFFKLAIGAVSQNDLNNYLLSQSAPDANGPGKGQSMEPPLASETRGASHNDVNKHLLSQSETGEL